MKRSKKHPKANLENYSKLFAQLGLVLSLLIVYILIQNKTYEREIIALTNAELIIDDTAKNVKYKLEEPKKKIKKQTAPKKIEKVPDDTNTEDPVFLDNDPDAPVETSPVIPDDPEELIDDVDDTVAFIVIEDAPVFPGCKGDKVALKKCFSKKISKFISKKFDTGLAEQLGLSPGLQRINTVFKIDKNGNIVNIQARSPHKSLQKEAIRVINLLPKMTPGKQRGNPVVVSYGLPIVFKVQ